MTANKEAVLDGGRASARNQADRKTRRVGRLLPVGDRRGKLLIPRWQFACSPASLTWVCVEFERIHNDFGVSKDGVIDRVNISTDSIPVSPRNSSNTPASSRDHIIDNGCLRDEVRKAFQHSRRGGRQ